MSKHSTPDTRGSEEDGSWVLRGEWGLFPTDWEYHPECNRDSLPPKKP